MGGPRKNKGNNITMTQYEFDSLIAIAMENAKLLLISQAPKRTLNLIKNIKVERTSNGFRLYVDDSVYYMVFTNEEWISPKWNWSNPNEGWFEMALDMISKQIASQLGSVAVRRE